MRSKVVVAVAVLFILAIGTAALAVNTRILNTSSNSDIGRADEVLIPSSPTRGAPPTIPAPSTAATATPTPTRTAVPTREHEPPSGEDHEAPDRTEHEPDD
ncbi:MAG: hypothetical protein WAW17_18070 [Rhodococcus sp. (in: high G+C Gram-positive bacteria)]|uniref:hypothetical protein n=1 Tax=Rhodococcus sp. TaxID=1831 RepID=UPI003BB0851F